MALSFAAMTEFRARDARATAATSFRGGGPRDSMAVQMRAARATFSGQSNHGSPSQSAPRTFLEKLNARERLLWTQGVHNDQKRGFQAVSDVSGLPQSRVQELFYSSQGSRQAVLGPKEKYCAGNSTVICHLDGTIKRAIVDSRTVDTSTAAILKFGATLEPKLGHSAPAAAPGPAPKAAPAPTSTPAHTPGPMPDSRTTKETTDTGNLMLFVGLALLAVVMLGGA